MGLGFRDPLRGVDECKIADAPIEKPTSENRFLRSAFSGGSQFSQVAPRAVLGCAVRVCAARTPSPEGCSDRCPSARAFPAGRDLTPIIGPDRNTNWTKKRERQSRPSGSEPPAVVSEGTHRSAPVSSERAHAPHFPSHRLWWDRRRFRGQLLLRQPSDPAGRTEAFGE